MATKQASDSKALRDTIEKFRQIQEELARETEELEQRSKELGGAMTQREAVRQTIEAFKLTQAELSRKTEELELAGKGKGIARDQLNRYLKGNQDLYSEALETLIRALPPNGRMHFCSLMLGAYSQQED